MTESLKGGTLSYDLGSNPSAPNSFFCSLFRYGTSIVVSAEASESKSGWLRGVQASRNSGRRCREVAVPRMLFVDVDCDCCPRSEKEVSVSISRASKPYSHSNVRYTIATSCNSEQSANGLE